VKKGGRKGARPKGSKKVDYYVSKKKTGGKHKKRGIRKVIPGKAMVEKDRTKKRSKINRGLKKQHGKDSGKKRRLSSGRRKKNTHQVGAEAENEKEEKFSVVHAHKEDPQGKVGRAQTKEGKKKAH